jgi:glyoxylase-like metal-dependent hydrolase (beta-lactamase superfamily II)
VKIELTNAQRGTLAIVPPDITFTEQVEVDLGGLTVEVRHVGGDHSPDCSIIFAVEEKVAFLGDCFYNGFSGATTFYTLARMFPLLDTLENLPAEYYILAHDPAPLPRAQFLREIEQMRAIGELVGKMPGKLHGKLPEREAVLARLPKVLGELPGVSPSEDQVDMVDALLRGLQGDV